MRSLEELDLIPTWVNPDHLVGTAVHVMQGHQISAIAVISGKELHGMVTLERALGMPRFARVDTIIQPLKLKIDDETSVRGAAKMFIENDTHYAAIYRGVEFVGLLTSNILLEEVGRSWDPLTNLPWSNRLRDWGSEQLQEGNEIALVFVDVDDFGDYNKRHGHIVGDAILKQVADRLRTTVDRYSEVLVRYGGDEFVIGTRLDRDTTEKKFDVIEKFQIMLPEVPEPVRVTVGFSGGLRSAGRENVHTASTLDNLINLASQDCTRRKNEKNKKPEQVAEVKQQEQEFAPKAKPQQSFEIRLVSVDEDDPSRPVAVTVRIGKKDGTGASIPGGRSLQDTVAEATCRAVERIVEGWSLEISTTMIDSGPDGEKVVTVVGWCESENGRLAMVGSRPVQRNAFRAVAEAVVSAYLAAQ